MNHSVCPGAPVKHKRVRKAFLSLHGSPRCLWPTSVTTEDVIDAATLAAETDAQILLDDAGLLLSLCKDRKKQLGPDPKCQVYFHA
jgi:hypothetical protein